MKACRPYLMHILQEIEYIRGESSHLNFEEFASDETLKRAFVPDFPDDPSISI